MNRRSHLVLVQGGKSQKPEEGPITRLGLWHRPEPVSSKLIAFLIFSKMALLFSVAYYLFG